MENKEIDKFLEEIHINFLKEGVSIWAETTGKSMEPVIREGDFVKIIPVKVEEIKRGEIVTFSRDTPKILTAHRLLSKEKDNFITCGDNFIFSQDPPLEKEDILGKVVAVRRNNRKRNLDKGFWYLYGKVITYLRIYGFPLLILFLSLYKFFTHPKLFFTQVIRKAEQTPNPPRRWSKTSIISSSH
ncbi:MAG: signal peptidase I [Candidatus Omnitrophica bacterium]|nr:signal peptidase I [Candidatus Omnitrophota bacterium]